MQNIQSAMLSLNQSLTNAAAVQQGVPFCISELNNNGRYSWSAQPTGTVTTATMILVGSLDGVNWYIIDTMTQADTASAVTVVNAWNNAWATSATASLAAGELRYITAPQVNFLRIDLTVISGGGSVNAQFSVFEADR